MPIFPEGERVGDDLHIDYRHTARTTIRLKCLYFQRGERVGDDL
jgi:hypothetical protein